MTTPETNPSIPLPDRIRAWVVREFHPRYVDIVTRGLIDVAAGNRPGNRFEVTALSVIMDSNTGGPQCS